MPNNTQQSAQEKLDGHFKRCYTDFPYYAKANLKIATKESGLVPFVLNEVQLLVDDITVDIEAANRLVRLFVLKARQEGISTYSTGKFFWKVTTKKNRYAVIITHEPPATQTLFEMQKRYLKHLAPEFTPEVKRSNIKMLQFDKDDTTGLDSSIKVATAGVKDFGSSQMIHYLHISELSKWPRENEADLLTSLYQCVPDTPDTAIVVESTAKGVGGEFYVGYYASKYMYEIYLDAEGNPAWKVTINKDADNANEFSSIFIPWFVFKKYRRPVPEDFKRTAEEELLVKKYGLDDEQLYWYRFVLTNKCRNDKAIRDQEYPLTAKSAFVGSGSPAFNTEQVVKLMEDAPKPIRESEFIQAKKVFLNKENGPLQVWELPKPGTAYVISADVAEGLEHGDFDSATVWNHMTGEQVAHFHAKLSPFGYAYMLESLGYMYNTAWLVPERNNHGISVVEKLMELEYPNIYVEMIPDPPHKARRRFGWVTTTKSRNLILDTLRYDVMTNAHGIKCKETFEEMLNFKTQKDGKVEADSGSHDDRVMDAAIGRYALKSLPFALAHGHRFGAGEQAGVMVNTNLIQQKPSVESWN